MMKKEQLKVYNFDKSFNKSFDDEKGTTKGLQF